MGGANDPLSSSSPSPPPDVEVSSPLPPPRKLGRHLWWPWILVILARGGPPPPRIEVPHSWPHSYALGAIVNLCRFDCRRGEWTRLVGCQDSVNKHCSEIGPKPFREPQLLDAPASRLDKHQKQQQSQLPSISRQPQGTVSRISDGNPPVYSFSKVEFDTFEKPTSFLALIVGCATKLCLHG